MVMVRFSRVGLAAVPMCHPQVIRSRQLIRHDGGNALKSQDHRDVLPGMNAGASLSAVPSPIEGSGTAWVLFGSWALSPARPTPIHPRPERRGFSALLVINSMVVVIDSSIPGRVAHFLPA